MKINVLAFHHLDNILSYANAIAKYTDNDITVTIISPGDKVFSGCFSEDIGRMPWGILHSNAREEVFPKELSDFLEPSLSISLLKLAGRKLSLRKPWTLVQAWISLRRLANQTRSDYDVLHFNGSGPYALMLSRMLKSSRKVLTIHDYVPHTGEGNRLIEILNKALVRGFSNHVQHYHYLAKALSKHYMLDRSKVHTLRSGTFDVFRQFIPQDPGFKNYILFFGRISPYKGLKYLVAGFNQYSQKHAGVKLVIAGKGDISDVEGEIRNNPRIHMLNRRITINELSGLVRGCICVVCPYLDATHSAVTMVSYTFGKPVIAHKVGGLAEVILDRETGLLVNDLSPDSIARAIEEMTHTPGLADGMQARIKQLCKTGFLAWDKIAGDYQKMYSELS